MEGGGRLLALKDFDGMEIPEKNSFERLLLVAQVAAKLYIKERAGASERPRMAAEEREEEREAEECEREAAALERIRNRKREQQREEAEESRTLGLLREEALLKKPVAGSSSPEILPPTPPPLNEGRSSTRKRSRRASSSGRGESSSNGRGKKQRVPEPPLPELPTTAPEQLRRYIEANGGSASEAALVIQKRLTATNMNPLEGRLSLPVRHLATEDFLTPDELEDLQGRDPCGKLHEMTVPLLELTRLGVTMIKLRRWEMKKVTNSSCSFVLCKPWNEVARHSGLHVGQLIQVWSFRLRNSDLHLALLPV